MLSILFQTLQDFEVERLLRVLFFSSNVSESCIIDNHINRFIKVLAAASSKLQNIVITCYIAFSKLSGIINWI